VTEGLTLRELDRSEWSEAMTLAARSFAGEPFMAELFGAEPLRRFELAHHLYRSAPWHDEDLHLGAFVADVMVGLCVTSVPGGCHICVHVDPERPPEDPRLVLDWQFEVNVRSAHADQGGHAWLSKVLVDPALRGAGIGRSLIVEALMRLRADSPAPVLLECQPHRESLYAACGFRRVRTFPDPAGPPAVLMRIDLDGPSHTRR